MVLHSPTVRRRTGDICLTEVYLELYVCYATASTEILLDMVTRMSDHKMGLVHQLPFTTDQSGFAAAVEKVLHARHSLHAF